MNQTEEQLFQKCIEDLGFTGGDPDIIGCMRDAWFYRAKLANSEVSVNSEQHEDLIGLVDGVRRALRQFDDPNKPLSQCITDAVNQVDVESLQARTEPWLRECFTEEVIQNITERNDRFLEEALELVQSLDYSKEQALAMVEYVYNREIGEPPQEVGGVMITLAALCIANAMDLHECAETELARIWTKVDQIRAKNRAKPRSHDNKDLF